MLFRSNAPVESIEGTTVWATLDGRREAIDAGDMIITAIGPQPNRDIVPEVEKSGVPHVLAGDCNQIGDFLSAVRDGWMIATALDMRLPAGRK